MKGLPRFRRRPYPQVLTYITRVLTNERQSPASQLVELVEFDDGHYRALFRPGFFVLAEGETEPTKSQWNTLKKKMKRLDPTVFILKDHGEAECDSAPDRCYTVDFGFFPDDPRKRRRLTT